jgi:hypothetical protein
MVGHLVEAVGGGVGDHDPAAAAAGRSMLSVPIPKRPIALQFFNPAMTSAVILA